MIYLFFGVMGTMWRDWQDLNAQWLRRLARGRQGGAEAVVEALGSWRGRAADGWVDPRVVGEATGRGGQPCAALLCSGAAAFRREHLCCLSPKAAGCGLVCVWPSAGWPDSWGGDPRSGQPQGGNAGVGVGSATTGLLCHVSWGPESPGWVTCVTPHACGGRYHRLREWPERLHVQLLVVRRQPWPWPLGRPSWVPPLLSWHCFCSPGEEWVAPADKGDSRSCVVGQWVPVHLAPHGERVGQNPACYTERVLDPPWYLVGVSQV